MFKRQMVSGVFVLVRNNLIFLMVLRIGVCGSSAIMDNI
jgi:hypothetical protein